MSLAELHHSVLQRRSRIAIILPGLLLCLAVSVVAYLTSVAEEAVFGRAWLEPLVLAIVIGTAVRSLWPLADRHQPGIAFSAKILLEVAVVLLGASMSGATLALAGPALLVGIAAVVVLAILLSFGVGRLLGLTPRLALLIACGNSICGNSAIAAVAPVIGADSDDVAASIAFTAVLGVIVVLALPALAIAFGLGGVASGALAGLTVYAVPQVIAATAPLGAVAIHMGTLVKLVRVMMLGPVCLVLSLLAPRFSPTQSVTVRAPNHLRLTQMVPWFVLGFMALMACRSLGFVPDVAIGPINSAAGALTVISMAALGLGVDVRVVLKAGGRVTAAVVLSLMTLCAISLLLIALLRLW